MAIGCESLHFLSPKLSCFQIWKIFGTHVISSCGDQPANHEWSHGKRVTSDLPRWGCAGPKAESHPNSCQKWLGFQPSTIGGLWRNGFTEVNLGWIETNHSLLVWDYLRSPAKNSFFAGYLRLAILSCCIVCSIWDCICGICSRRHELCIAYVILVASVIPQKQWSTTRGLHKLE